MMTGRDIVMRTCSLLLFACLAVPRPVAQQLPSREQPAFRTEVDIIPVDVVVLDGKGSQVTDLQADAFTVTIDGRPRRILSSRYISYTSTAQLAAQTAGEVSLPSSSSPRISTNQASPGRLVMVVVDEPGMDFGGTRVAIEGLKRFLLTLGPRDVVGLSVLPYPGVAVPFTRDHARIIEAMTQVSGQRLLHEPHSIQQVGWAEALDYMRTRGESPDWREVVQRECSYCGRDSECWKACTVSCAAEASAMVAEMRGRVAEFSGGMRNLLAYLRAVDAPKTLVLLSSGMVADPAGDNEISSLGRDASAARCSIYALRFNAWDFPDAAERKPSPSRSVDLQLQRTSLEWLAGQTRGWVYDLVGGAGPPLDKLSAELSGFYLLGVESNVGDRDGKTHQIRVDVARRNVSLRSRRELVWKEASPALRSPADAVRTMLTSPIDANDVPLRVTSYAGPAPESGKVRVLISAEIGRELPAEQELSIGWALVSANGKVSGAGYEQVKLKPAAGRSSAPLSFVRAPLVEAGRYTLRLAVLDRAGHGGSITHEVDARLRSAGPLAVGDLVIGTPPADAKSDFEPPVDCVIDGDRLFVYWPATSTDTQTLAKAKATIEISRSGDERALLQSTILLAGRRADQRDVQATVGLGLLPPGSYVARVRLSTGGTTAVTASRDFLFAPAPGVTTAASGISTGGAVAAGLAAPRFTLGDVLAPSVVAPFLDRAAKAAPDLPAAVFADAKAGRFAAAVSGLPAEAAGPVPPFLRGLALLERADLEGAAREFRDSRRASPEFVDTIVFLGVCLVAGGKDAEAVGALQTARFGLDDEPLVHHLLIDTRLRLQQIEPAKALAEDATRRWPDDSRFQVQLARTLAAGGDAVRALSVLDAYLASHKDDADALFFALRLLYASAAGAKAKPTPSVAGRFRDYAALYEAVNGPDRALVREWLKYVTR